MLAVWRYHSHISWDSRSGIYRIPVCVLRDLWWESHPPAPTILDTIIINIEKNKKKKTTKRKTTKHNNRSAIEHDADIDDGKWSWHDHEWKMLDAVQSIQSSNDDDDRTRWDDLLIIFFFYVFPVVVSTFLFIFFVFVSRIRAVCEPFNLVNGHLNWRLYFFVANM